MLPLTPALRDAAPVVARRHNLVYVAPPAPVWAGPLLGALAPREPGLPALALVPAAGLEEWTRVAAATAGVRGIRVVGARTAARTARALVAGTVDLLVLTPELAHTLVGRSALAMAQVSALFLLLPEQWGPGDLVSDLLQDAGREAQRVVVTSTPDATRELIERHCWKAPVIDATGGSATGAAAARVVTTGWSRRIEAMRDVVEQLDPGLLTIWTADLAERDAILGAFAGLDVAVTDWAPEGNGLLIAYDLPTPALAAQFAERHDLVLLVPPGGEEWAKRIAARRRPLPLTGAIDQVRSALDSARRAVVDTIERGPSASSFLAIGPLLERYEAGTVAAAAWELWEAARHAAPPAEESRTPAGRIWLAIGKRDGVTPNDLVGAVIKTGGVAQQAVGKVEIRESFSLVEVPDAGAVAERMAGVTIRRKRVAVRVDQGIRQRATGNRQR